VEHHRTTRERRLIGALVLNVAIVVVQVVVGLSADSLGLLADAAHNLTDVAAVAVSLLAVRFTRRRATQAKSFGYHRATTLAAQANAVSILVVTALITVEAIRRLSTEAQVQGGSVIAAAAAAAVVNFGAALFLHGDHDDLNMRSALLHMLADGAVSVAVVVVGVVIAVTGGWFWLDPAVSMVIALVIGVQAVRLLRAAADVLLESAPHGLDMDALIAAVEGVDGVDSVHDVHVWTLSTEVRAMSAHLVVEGSPSLQQAQSVGASVKSLVGADFGIAHATLELECDHCGAEAFGCLDH